jgi:hypothetical protein
LQLPADLSFQDSPLAASAVFIPGLSSERCSNEMKLLKEHFGFT